MAKIKYKWITYDNCMNIYQVEREMERESLDGWIVVAVNKVISCHVLYKQDQLDK